jgi:hypothetical protein
MPSIWKEIFAGNQANTALAASSSENIASSVANLRKYTNFNKLSVSNRDVVDIQIRLDGLTTDGKIFDIPAGATFTINPEEGMYFRFFSQHNLSATTAQTADKIQFRWSKCEEVG